MRGRKAWLGVVGVVTIAVLLGPVSPAVASFPGRNGLLAVERQGDIWTMTLGGRFVRQLTNTGNNGLPQWSPDGKRIAFNSWRTGRDQVFTMNADGSGVTQVTTAASDQAGPTWSPDGRWIAFSSSRGNRHDVCGDSTWDIYKLRSTVPYGPALQVTHEMGSESAYSPAWSPDGKTILAVVDADPDCWDSVVSTDIQRVSVVTGAESATKDTVGCEDAPDWAPTSNKMSFWATIHCPDPNYAGGGPWNLYQSNSDGTGLIQLTHYSANDGDGGNAAWAPSGAASLVFFYGHGTNTGWTSAFYQINANGTGLRTILTVNATGGQPPIIGPGLDWQPLP